MDEADLALLFFIHEQRQCTPNTCEHCRQAILKHNPIYYGHSRPPLTLTDWHDPNGRNF
jgi:hypothetical protein